MKTQLRGWIVALFLLPLFPCMAAANPPDKQASGATWRKREEALVAKWKDEQRKKQEPFVQELEAMLGDDTKLTLYSIGDVTAAEEDEKVQQRPDHFHRFPIRGCAPITDKAEIATLLNALVGAIRATDGQAMDCFDPHHGLVVKCGKKKIDLLICFTCRQGESFGATSEPFMLTDAALDVFNASLKRHDLPLPAARTKPR